MLLYIVGDFNGDGIDDMIIGAYGASPSGYTSSGQSYLIYGSTATLSSIIYLDNSIDGFNNGLNGFLINGPHNTSSYTGSSVSSAGDINNDGFADLIIGMGSPYDVLHTHTDLDIIIVVTLPCLYDHRCSVNYKRELVYHIWH